MIIECPNCKLKHTDVPMCISREGANIVVEYQLICCGCGEQTNGFVPNNHGRPYCVTT
jgi:hypothetical protein